MTMTDKLTDEFLNKWLLTVYKDSKTRRGK